LSGELTSGVANWSYQGQLSVEDWNRQLNKSQETLVSQVAHLLQQAKVNPTSISKRELDASAKTIFSELFGLSSAAKNVAFLDSEQVSLLHGAKVVAESISKLFTTVDQISTQPQDSKLQAQLLDAEHLFERSIEFLNGAKEGTITDKVFILKNQQTKKENREKERTNFDLQKREIKMQCLSHKYIDILLLGRYMG
jgi:hypothetical protein